jgi:hypothetical protein
MKKIPIPLHERVLDLTFMLSRLLPSIGWLNVELRTELDSEPPCMGLHPTGVFIDLLPDGYQVGYVFPIPGTPHEPPSTDVEHAPQVWSYDEVLATVAAFLCELRIDPVIEQLAASRGDFFNH